MADARAEAEKDPTAKNRLKYAFAHYKARDFDRAASLFRQLKSEPDVKKASIFGYAYSLAGLEKYAEAAQWLRVLADEDLSKNAKADTLLDAGKLYWHVKRVDDAHEMFKRRKYFNPTNLEAHMGSGLCAGYKGRFGDASADFLKAANLAKTDTQKARALAYVALSEESAGRIANGKKYYEQALALDRQKATSVYEDFWKDNKRSRK